MGRPACFKPGRRRAPDDLDGRHCATAIGRLDGIGGGSQCVQTAEQIAAEARIECQAGLEGSGRSLDSSI